MEEPGRADDEKRAKSVLQALDHDLRRRIMRILLVGDSNPLDATEASRRVDAPLSRVSYHLRVLTQSGAVDITQERPVRGSVKRLYRANSAVAKMPSVAEALSSWRSPGGSPCP